MGKHPQGLHSSSVHPPTKTPSEDFHMQTHSLCEEDSALHFHQSQQAINATHPWGFGSHYSLLEKNHHEKNQREELIEPAAVCSTYQTSQSSCCCTGFFLYKRWAGESWAKTRTKCLHCPSMTTLLPRRRLCLLWALAREHFDVPPALILHFCLLQWEVFSFFSFCLNSLITVENDAHKCMRVKPTVFYMA